MKLRSGTTYNQPKISGHSVYCTRHRANVLNKIASLNNRIDSKTGTLRKIKCATRLYKYISKNITYIESSCFNISPDLFNIINRNAENLMDGIDFLLIKKNTCIYRRMILLDALEKISSVYYRWNPDNYDDYDNYDYDEELEHDYLNTYLED